MMDVDPKQFTTALFVAVGLVISQLFIYGKKVKRRVKITTAELVGDIMQFGVRMAITIASIRAMEIVIRKPIEDIWQIVATTILICTSFDTYFVKIREIALKRVVGAAGVLLGRLPDDAFVEIQPDSEHQPAMKVTTVENVDKLTDPQAKIGLPLRRAYLPKPGEGKDQQEIIDLLKNLDGNTEGDNL